MAVQAIAGVSASNEAVVWTEYPSIAAIGIGQTLGSLYESLPIKILGFGPSLSHIFALLTAPIGVLLYAAQKLFGHRYILTNRNVHVRSSRGDRMISTIGLGDFDHIELVQNPGQVFYKAADIRFLMPVFGFGVAVTSGSGVAADRDQPRASICFSEA